MLFIKNFLSKAVAAFYQKSPCLCFSPDYRSFRGWRTEIVSAFRQDEDGRGVALVRDLFSRLVFEINMQIQI